jgi:hypothetical protein
MGTEEFWVLEKLSQAHSIAQSCFESIIIDNSLLEIQSRDSHISREPVANARGIFRCLHIAVNHATIGAVMSSDPVPGGFAPTKWKRLKFIQDARIQRSGDEIVETLCERK